MFRLENNLSISINRLNQLLFFHSENIFDLFYYDFYNGVVPLKKALFNFYNQKVNCNVAVHIDHNSIVTPLNDLSLSLLSKFIINTPTNQANPYLNTFDDSEYEPTTSADLINIKQFFNNKPSKNLIELSKFLLLYKGKKLLIIESLEWLAELFLNRPHDFTIIKLISQWLNTPPPNLYIAVLIRDPEVLKIFYQFNLENEYFLKVPSPTTKEIFSSLYRYLFLNHKFIINHDKLSSLAQAFKTNNLKLKAILHIFKKELNEHLKENDDIFDLYSKFNKYLNSPIEEKIDFDNDIILDKEIKERVKQEFNNFIENKAESKKGIILTGPPGTGKTIIAKAIAKMGGFNFMALKLSDLKQMYVGHSSAEVKKIFEEARNLQPTIMFIDELDAVFPKRQGSGNDSFTQDITNEFIAQVDGVDTGKQRIFIIGATNIPEVLDSAVISRFDMQMIPLPNKPEREKMFNLYIPSLSNTNWKSLDKDKILDKTLGLSGRDIKDISKTINTKINDSKQDLPDRNTFDVALEIFKEKVISTNKDKFYYLDYKKNKHNFKNIIGYDEIKKNITLSVVSIFKEKELKKYNILSERGILLDGPPGNGKSFIAECVAGEFNIDFIKVLSKDISSSLYGEDSKKLSDIFDSAFKIARLSKKGCLLFFDEFDGVASKNANLNLRATMLDFLIRSRKITNLVFMAATNYKEYLDEATIREGRFDKKITIKNPERPDVLDLLEIFLEEIDPIFKKNKIDNQISGNMYENILDLLFAKKEASFRSIAGIKVFTNNLKRHAYFSKKIDSENRLIIDDLVVKNYLRSI